MLSIALGLGMLAGCGSKAPVESKGESTAAVSGEAAAYKKDVVVGTQGPIKTVDVQSGSNVYHNVLFRLTHDSLVYPNPETGKIEPRLATEWKWIDDNTIEFKLRDGGRSWEPQSPLNWTDLKRVQQWMIQLSR